MGFSSDFSLRYKEPELVLENKAQDAMFGISEKIRSLGDLMLEEPTEPNIIAYAETVKHGIKMGGFIKKWFEGNNIYDVEPEEILSAFFLMNLGAVGQGDPTAYPDIIIQNVHASNIGYGLNQLEITPDQITSGQISQIRLIIKWLLYHYNSEELSVNDKSDCFKTEIRLIDVVKKQNNSGNVFTDINNDLGFYVDENKECGPMIMMAYAYARRLAVAALCLQRIVDKDQYDYVYQIFKALQLSTGQTQEFQREAADQARELIYSYTNLFSKDALNTMVVMVEDGRFDLSKSADGSYIDTQTLANMFGK